MNKILILITFTCMQTKALSLKKTSNYIKKYKKQYLTIFICIPMLISLYIYTNHYYNWHAFWNPNSAHLAKIHNQNTTSHSTTSAFG